MANFTLISMKKIRDGGLHVEWETTHTEDGTIMTFNHNEDRPVTPHKDLIDLLDKLRAPLLKTWGFYEAMTIIEKGNVGKDEMEAFTKVKKYIKGLWEGNLNKTEITGFSLSGEDLDKIKITGKFDDIAGTPMAMNSPLINTTQDRYGIEQTVAGIIEELCEEVELYMLENKRADIEQASIGSDD